MPRSAMLQRLEEAHGLVRRKPRGSHGGGGGGWDLNSCVWWFGICVDRRGGPGEKQARLPCMPTSKQPSIRHLPIPAERLHPSEGKA